MITGFIKKLKEKQHAKLIRKQKLKGIDYFPLGDEWEASEKKKKELEELIGFLISLVDNHDFKVMRSWGTGLPKDSYLRKDYKNAEILIEPHVEVSGQNYDRVGKISIGLNWTSEGVYDEKANKYIGEVDKSKECSLKTFKKILPEIIRNFESNNN